jgi:hypothetical protein
VLLRPADRASAWRHALAARRGRRLRPRARAAGLEGYAVDPEEKLPDADAYHGTVSIFEGAGFRRAHKAESPGGRHDRWIMRLESD